MTAPPVELVTAPPVELMTAPPVELTERLTPELGLTGVAVEAHGYAV